MKVLNHFYNEARVQKEAELVKGFNNGEFNEYKCGFLYSAYDCPNYEINSKANDKMSFFVNDNGRLLEVETSFKEIDLLFKNNKELKRNKYSLLGIKEL